MDPEIEVVSILRGDRELVKAYIPDSHLRLSHPSELLSFAESPDYLAFLKNHRQRTLWVTPTKEAAPRLVLYYPLFGHQGRILSLRVSVALHKLWKEIPSQRVGGTGFAVLLGAGGVPLIYPADQLLESDLPLLREWPIGATALGRTSVGALDFADMRPRMRGRIQLGAYAPVPDISAVVIIQQPRDEALIAVIRMKRLAYSIIGLACLGAFCAAFWMTRRITQPLLQLIRGAETVAAGEFPEGIRIQTQDELQKFGDTFNAMVIQLKDRERLRETFGKYVSVEVARRLLDSGKVDLGGEEIEATVLFCDIRNFTTMSERMTPKQVVSFLNSYFSYVTVPITDNHGIVSKFIGDAIMAVFTPIFGSEHHAIDAVQSALRMKVALSSFNSESTPSERVEFGIGIQTGKLVAGNVGTIARLEYTVIGDTVNVASRVESATKEFGADILLGEDVHAMVGDAFREKAFFEKIGPVGLKGKTKQVVLYRLRDATNLRSG